jgi:hypothetical protein
MARKLAAEAVDARADQAPSIEQPGTSPRLVSRSPDLRAIDGGADDPTAPEDDATSTSPGDGEPPSIHDQLGDALRRRQIKPNDAEKS